MNLDALPEQMLAAERRAKKYEKAIIDLLEVYLLADRIGHTFLGTVIDVDRDKKHGTLMITNRQSRPGLPGSLTPWSGGPRPPDLR
jgi:hypothetical protein